MNSQDPHEMRGEQALIPAFRAAMDALDRHIRNEGAETDLFAVYKRVSDLAQTVVHQFDNMVYELAAQRQRTEELQLAHEKLKTQFEYRERRESILEQAYVETQLALKSTEILMKRADEERIDTRKAYNVICGKHAHLVEELSELKGENEQLKIGLASAERFLEEERKLGKLTSDELDDVKKAHAITKQDNSRLRMLARNRRHALIEVGNFLGGLPSTAMKGEALNDMIERVAAMARPVDYRTGAALDQTEVYLGIQAPAPADADKLHVIAEDGSVKPVFVGVDLAAGPVHTVVVDGMFIDAESKQSTPDVNMASDTPVETAVWYDGQGMPHYDTQEPEVAEKLGYSKRAHDFPPGENMKDVACTRCGIGWLECVDDNHYCNAEEADDSGVNLGAQITSVAEAIQNGESQH